MQMPTGSVNEDVVIETPAPGASLSTDIVVIGSGAGGAAVAGELRRLGRQVVLVEAGPLEPGDHVRHLTDRADDSKSFLLGYEDLVVHANTADPIRGIEGARSFYGPGGLMSRWAGVTPRPHLSEEWDGTIDAVTMTELLDDAERLLNSTPTSRFRNADAPLHQWMLEQLWARFGRPGDVEAAASVQRVAGRIDDDGVLRLTGVDALLRAESRVPPAVLIPGYAVNRIIHDGERATGVRAREFAGLGEIQIDAEVIVVAAGVIATPQILVASGMDRSPALGRYLMDHLVLVFEDVDVARAGAPAGSVNVCLPVTPGRPFHTSVGAMLSQYPDPDDPDPVAQRRVGVGIFLGTEPRAENRLLFHPEDLDSLGLPAVSAEFALSDSDHAHASQAAAFGYEVCAALGGVWGVTRMRFEAVGSSLHLMGTHRIGADPATSVADPTGRLWGWSNVYVAGNGALGWRNSVNPTLTTVALGLNTARAIATHHVAGGVSQSA